MIPKRGLMACAICGAIQGESESLRNELSKYKESFADCDVKRASLIDAIQEFHGMVSTLAYYFKGALPHQDSSAYSSHVKMDLNVIEDTLKKSDELFRVTMGINNHQER